MDMTALTRMAPHTVYQYRRVSGRFLLGCSNADSPTRDDVLRFIAACNSAAYKQFVYFVLRRLFVANEWHWPLPARSSPKVGVHDQAWVQMPPGSVDILIHATPLMSSQDIFYLALSTVYGLRRLEMARVTADSFRDRMLSVQTVKGGERRLHAVPDVIEPYMYAAPEVPVTVDHVQRVFRTMVRQSGQSLPAGAGPHAIRRSLVSALSLACPEAVVVRFMGWRTSGGSRIMYRYARPSPTLVDDQVFAIHPYLPIWAEVSER